MQDGEEWVKKELGGVVGSLAVGYSVRMNARTFRNASFPLYSSLFFIIVYIILTSQSSYKNRDDDMGSISCFETLSFSFDVS